MLVQTGICVDDRPVIDFFKMVETRGVPLEIALDALNELNVVPDWMSFINQSVKCDWNLERTLLKLEVAIKDVYGSGYYNEWKVKMDSYLESDLFKNTILV